MPDPIPFRVVPSARPADASPRRVSTEVRARLDDTQVSNGSAELHFSFIGPPPDVCTVDARVIQWSDYAAHLQLEARTPDGQLAATALTTMSLRPLPPGATPDTGRW